MSTGVAASKGEGQVYFGTYTGNSSRGIYAASFDSSTGKLGTPELAAETRNPTFLALHPKGRTLYAVNEIENFGGEKSGSVSAFKVEPRTGRLTLLNQQPSGGAGPCHLSLDPAGKCVLVANYGSGSVALLPLRADGGLQPPSTSLQHHGSGVNPQRQAGPHAHFVTPDPAGRFALSCDLGLDKIFVNRLDPDKGTLQENDPAFFSVRPGSGPRHLAFHPDGAHLYQLNEMVATLSVFAWEQKTGTLKELQTVPTLPEDFKGQNLAAEVQVHPSGRFVYISNRGFDSIGVFAIEPSGTVKMLQQQPSGGKGPRHFALDPTGRWLLVENQDSNNVVVFSVDERTGRLKESGEQLPLGAPVCSVFAKTTPSAGRQE